MKIKHDLRCCEYLLFNVVFDDSFKNIKSEDKKKEFIWNKKDFFNHDLKGYEYKEKEESNEDFGIILFDEEQTLDYEERVLNIFDRVKKNKDFKYIDLLLLTYAPIHDEFIGFEIYKNNSSCKLKEYIRGKEECSFFFIAGELLKNELLKKQSNLSELDKMILKEKLLKRNAFSSVPDESLQFF